MLSRIDGPPTTPCFFSRAIGARTSQMTLLAIASDHGGFALKEALVEALTEWSVPFVDLGPRDRTSCDYPDFAHAMARGIAEGRYERGVSRPAADTLKRLADALGVSGDYLLEGAVEEAARAGFEDRELLQQFQEIEKLPEEDKAVVKRFLDAFLTKKQLQKLAAR